MRLKALLFFVCIVLLVDSGFGQEFNRWNFTIGGGIGFPQSTSASFVNNGANFVVGAGPNLRKFLGLDAEFMWHDLPVKRNVINALQVPDASARLYSVTFNGIVPIPTHGKVGFYLIGGGGWYHRSGELTEPGLVHGTVCEPFWIWWGDCVDGLIPGNKVLASSSSDTFGGNIGGGITYRFGMGSIKFYSEARYHHAPHNHINTDILPLTFGLRW